VKKRFGRLRSGRLMKVFFGCSKQETEKDVLLISLGFILSKVIYGMDGSGR
jgi:hypothetical protein